jgi:hypothetical protein
MDGCLDWSFLSLPLRDSMTAWGVPGPTPDGRRLTKLRRRRLRSGVIHENPHPPPNYFATRLDRLAFTDDDARVVLVFIRLRALLFALCPDHPVALCGTCRRTYTPEQLGTKIGDGCYLCYDCGGDLRESIIAHARTCPNFIPQKPLARMASVTSSAIRIEVSERFATQRRARLGLDVRAAAR